GIGAEVPIGSGIIGVVAKRKKLMRMGGLSLQRTYVAAATAESQPVGHVVPLPGLPDADSVVAVPLVKRDDLIGVFYVESVKLAVSGDADLARIEAAASHAAVAIQNARYHEAEKKRLEELEAANRSLTAWNASSQRFVPHEFLAILGRKELPEVERGD